MLSHEKIKFAVVGGGTAGWLTALFLQNKFPHNNITLIESSEIGILGAGEGTTPHFVTLLEQIGINIKEVIKETKATIKNGVKFTNWHGDGSYYYHPLDQGNFNLDKYDEKFKFKYYSENKTLNDLTLANQCGIENKVLFTFNNNNEFCRESKPALHFDARLMAEFLKKVGLQRGVNLIDSKVVKINEDHKGNICSLLLENNNLVDCTFVFDCTGFRREIIGKYFNSEWLDYQDSLPCDTALPFFLKNETSEIPPYTEAIAMKNGWVWKIPVQGRFGCGYVFDSSYISEDEAKKEIQSLFGNDIEFPRCFKFKAGYFNESWKKNVVAIGLSSGFIEPLEATSIWVSIHSLSTLFEKCFPSILDTNNEEYRRYYNDSIRYFNGQIKDFLQIHYFTSRSDSLFWKEFRQKNKISDNIEKFCELDNVFAVEQHSLSAFPNWDVSWVFAGVGFYNSIIYKKYMDYVFNFVDKENFHDDIKNFQNQIKQFSYFKAIDHYKFLQHINNLN